MGSAQMMDRLKVSSGMLVLLLAMVLPFCAYSSERKSGDRAFVKVSLPDVNFYPDVPVICDIVLYSESPEIEGVDMMAKPDFGGLNFRQLSTPRSRYGEATVSGTKYYTNVILRYLLEAPSEGSYKIKPGEYSVAVPGDEVYVDRFWGTRYRKPEYVKASGSDAGLKVKRLPEPPKGEKTYGAVGDFTAEWNLPPGRIEKDSEAIAVLVVKGVGILSDEDVPDISSCFGDNLRFLGMTAQANNTFRNGSIYSTLYLECRFVPEMEGELQLDAFAYPYLDSSTGKYRKAKASQLLFNVKYSSSLPHAKPSFEGI